LRSCGPRSLCRIMAAGGGKVAARKKRRATKEETNDAVVDGQVGDENATSASSSSTAPSLLPSDGAVMVLGTYDGALLGLSAEDGSQLFGFAPHIGCVKALATSRLGRCASGGSDHTVRLFDLGRSLELGELQEHDDCISCVEFWGITTLVTGSEDGSVCIWRTGDWELLLKFRAHKAAVACIAIHPSGRLMASGCRDRGVRLWDLTRGTSAANLNLDTDPPEELQWSASGDMLSALSSRELLAVMARTGSTAAYRDPNSSGLTRISLTTSLFLGDRTLLLGDGKGDVRVLSRSDGASTLVETCRLPEDRGRGRTKALAHGGGFAAGPQGWFAAGFSSGRVEIWQCNGPKSGHPELSHFTLLKSVDTSVRLTSLALWAGRVVAEAAVAEDRILKEKAAQSAKDKAASKSKDAGVAEKVAPVEGAASAKAKSRKKRRQA